MRIESNRPLRAAAARRGVRADASGGSFAETLAEMGDAPSAAPVATPGGLAGLLALQEMPDATARRRQAVARGKDMLDRLDDLRLGLLAGTMPRDRIADLARMVKAARAEVDDPRLAEVLDEIDLRAAVELAKLEAAA
jgi:Class II flagellar assembly regulator